MVEKSETTGDTGRRVALEPRRTLHLAGDHQLLVERRQGEDVLRLEAPGGKVRISVTVTADGASVELDGADLAVRTSGNLDLDVRRLTLRGREGLTLESGADLGVLAEGSVRIAGLEQHLEARLGDLSVRANDDVRIDGERIKMNC